MSDAPPAEAESTSEADADSTTEAASTAEADADSTAEADSTEVDADLDAAVDLDFGETGRVPAVAQSADTGEVLMLAYATAEAVRKTRETGRAHYYSRSREELWQKGATSGHVQRVREVRVDCDGDALLYLVDQEGGACHTGYESCFYRTLDGETVGEKVFDPDEVYQ